MLLYHNNSDKKDAKRIYDFGIERNLFFRQMIYRYDFNSSLLNITIHDSTNEITRLTNQLQTLKRCPFESRSVEKCQERLLKKLREERQELELSLEELLQEWEGDLLKLVRSIKGIGKRAAAELLIFTKCFQGMKSYRQLISYAGLSPVEYSSGSSVRGRSRICKQGGKQLRHILYMCALNAKKTNASCRALFDRLVAKGKNKKAAVIAVANKLLKQVFGVVKNGVMYQDHYVKNIC